ncbi:unnamed protein product [Withania somnifera]
MESEKCPCWQFQQHDLKYYAHSPKTWPELVGLLGDEAAKVIQTEIPNLRIEFIHPPWALTQDYCFSRVRILVDSFNKVSMPPSIG